MDRRRRKPLMIALGSILALVVVIAAGLPVYVLPPAEDGTDADLIYVIGPPRRERVAVERDLRATGVAPLSLYSVQLTGGWSAERLPVCREEAVYCVHPEPFTTKGEIAYLSRFAAEHDVRKTVVLTFTPHVARTRYILDKCYDGDAVVQAVAQRMTPLDWAGQYIYQTAAFVKAWLTPCADL